MLIMEVCACAYKFGGAHDRSTVFLHMQLQFRMVSWHAKRCRLGRMTRNSGSFVSNQQALVLLVQVSIPGQIAGTHLVQCTDLYETMDGVSRPGIRAPQS